MADLSITAASVVGPLSGAKTAIAGAAITAGQSLYKKGSDSKLYLAQADGASAEEASFEGIALCNAAAGQPVLYQPLGDITIGATVAKGKVYVVSATAGGICPDADITTTGHYKTVIGYGKDTATLTINPIISGVTMP